MTAAFSQASSDVNCFPSRRYLLCQMTISSSVLPAQMSIGEIIMPQLCSLVGVVFSTELQALAAKQKVTKIQIRTKFIAVFTRYFSLSKISTNLTSGCYWSDSKPLSFGSNRTEVDIITSRNPHIFRICSGYE